MNQPRAVSQPARIALVREASMASVAIGVGLTHLRRYNYLETGYFYSGILSLSSGLERAMKLILISDYRLQNQGDLPENGYLIKYGHKLNILHRRIDIIRQKHGIEIDSYYDYGDEIFSKILDFLHDFAMGARYYNLDSVSCGDSKSIDPLIRWENEICREILTGHHK